MCLHVLLGWYLRLESGKEIHDAAAQTNFPVCCYYFCLVDSKLELMIQCQPEEERHGGLLMLSGSDVQLPILQETDLGNELVRPLVTVPWKVMKTLTKQNMYTLHLLCIHGFVVVRYTCEATKVRNNIPSLPYKQLTEVYDFPSCCFPLHATFAWEHLMRKDTVMCNGVDLQVIHSQNERDRSSKNHF